MEDVWLWVEQHSSQNESFWLQRSDRGSLQVIQTACRLRLSIIDMFLKTTKKGTFFPRRWNRDIFLDSHCVTKSLGCTENTTRFKTALHWSRLVSLMSYWWTDRNERVRDVFVWRITPIVSLRKWNTHPTGVIYSQSNTCSNYSCAQFIGLDVFAKDGGYSVRPHDVTGTWKEAKVIKSRNRVWKYCDLWSRSVKDDILTH